MQKFLPDAPARPASPKTLLHSILSKAQHSIIEEHWITGIPRIFEELAGNALE